MEILGSSHIVNERYYCGGPVTSLHQWLNSTNSTAAWEATCSQFRDRQVIGTYSGRSAIALVCRLFGIALGDEILVPAYNCGTELDALIYAGAKLVGYPVSRKCEIDLEDLMTRKTHRTRAVYLIHYFGWEQPMEKLRRWCDTHGLLLIEDCALALFSQGTSGGIGQTGDAAIFSLPKTLGTLHGGLLSLAPSRPTQFPDLKPPGGAILRNEIRHSARAAVLRIAERFGLHSILFAARRWFGRKHRTLPKEATLPPMPPDYYFNAGQHANRSLHPRIFSVVSSVSSSDIVVRRRSNYLTLARNLREIPGVEMLYPQLPEGVCPLSMPLLVADRNACVGALLARGIAALPWWAGFHLNSLDWAQFPDACFLKGNLLTLPVHQGLDDRHMKYIAREIRSFASQPNPSIAASD